MHGENRIRRLRWSCRRGMKELDVVLEAFLEHHHESLRRGGWPQLENLLAQEDERLWEWLLNPEKAAAFSPLIDALRKRT